MDLTTLLPPDSVNVWVMRGALSFMISPFQSVTG